MTEQKTFKQHLQKYEFTDYEDDIPLVSDMFHEEDIIKAITEWLTQKNQETQEAPNNYHYTTRQVRTELLNELMEDLKKDE
jgi:hydrogenase maturation factor